MSDVQPVITMIKSATPQSAALRQYLECIVADSMATVGYSADQIVTHLSQKKPYLDGLTSEEIGDRLLREMDPYRFHAC